MTASPPPAGSTSARVDTADLGRVQETMLLPLLVRALETRRPDAIIRDHKAVEIAGSLGVENPGVAANWLMRLSIAIRTEVFDREVARFIASREAPVVVNLGAGLDARFERVDDGRVRWFDVDLPDSIDLRRRFFAEGPRRRFLAASAFGDQWWQEVFAGRGDQVLVLAEGLLMYFPQDTVHGLFLDLAEQAPGGEMLFESISRKMIGTQNRVRGAEGMRAEWVWGVEAGTEVAAIDPRILHRRDHHYIDRHRERWRHLAWLKRLPWVRRELRASFKSSLVCFAPGHATHRTAPAKPPQGAAADRTPKREAGREVNYLPLTAFERYMLLDDRPTHPMTFTLRLRFEGEADRERLQAAMRAAVARHPLLSALVEQVGGRRRWAPRPDAAPRIRWTDWGEPPGLVAGIEAIDLTENPGLRIWFESRGGESRLLAQFHHACCDGVGALRFLGDWLAKYDADARGVAPRWPEIDPAALNRRGRRRWAAAGMGRPARQALVSQVVDALRWHSRAPAPIGAPDPIPVTAAGNRFPAMESVTLPGDATRSLVAAARRSGATVNDLLIHALLRVLAALPRGPRRPAEAGDWLRINMPTSLRDADDVGLSAANVVGYAFLDRRRRDCVGSASDALLAGLAAETRAIRDGKLGRQFLAGLAIADSAPGLLAAATRWGGCSASAVLSNVGDVTRRFGVRLPRESECVAAGGLRLVSCEGVPPLRPKTHVAVGAILCGGRLTLTARTDRVALPPDAAPHLLQALVGRLPIETPPA